MHSPFLQETDNCIAISNHSSPSREELTIIDSKHNVTDEFILTKYMELESGSIVYRQGAIKV